MPIAIDDRGFLRLALISELDLVSLVLLLCLKLERYELREEIDHPFGLLILQLARLANEPESLTILTEWWARRCNSRSRTIWEPRAANTLDWCSLAR